MYSKRLTEFGRQHLEQQKKAIKEHHLPALPVSQTKGMKDFVMKFVSYDTYTYTDVYERVMDDSEWLPGGYLKPKGWYPRDSYIITDDIHNQYMAMMDAFDKYICSDGVIRYIPSEEARAKYRDIYEQLENEEWERINSAFEELGMFYDEDRACWVNPTTGEVGCY